MKLMNEIQVHFRFSMLVLSNNGEINTLQSNVNWSEAIVPMLMWMDQLMLWKLLEKNNPRNNLKLKLIMLRLFFF
ncbi:hypothetical protein P3L10_032177 [Capsicum annuum]